MDIQPKGFSAIEIDGYVTDDAVRKTRRVLNDAKLRRRMVRHNYETARIHFSYTVLRQRLKQMIQECTACKKVAQL
jgi:hypothetical protein